MSNKNATQKRIKQHQQRVYANPLPILIDQRPSTFAVGVCIFGKKSIINPQCIGTYVSETQSVWVTNEGILEFYGLEVFLVKVPYPEVNLHGQIDKRSWQLVINLVSF